MKNHISCDKKRIIDALSAAAHSSSVVSDASVKLEAVAVEAKPRQGNDWAVKYEHGKLSFANFESALAYANGLSKGTLSKKIIDPVEHLIEVWLEHQLQSNPGTQSKLINQISQTDQTAAVVLPC